MLMDRLGGLLDKAMPNKKTQMPDPTSNMDDWEEEKTEIMDSITECADMFTREEKDSIIEMLNSADDYETPKPSKGKK